MKDALGEAHEAVVPASERHARGQYFTPFPVIRLVLDLCAEGMPTPRSVMDPACGSGRFLMAAQERWPRALLLGYETDPEALTLAGDNLPGAELKGRSFLDVRRPRRVDLLVGNPPYVRQRGKKRDLYVDFLEAAPRWLTSEGRLGLVLSSAWLDVEYGQVIRDLLVRDFAVEFIVESAAERWFPGAKVNTMVLVARREPKRLRSPHQPVSFSEVRAPLPAEPTVVRHVLQKDLASDRPWGPYLRAPEWWIERWGMVARLDDLADVRRGWTTNDNGFFYPRGDAGIEDRWLRPLVKSPKEVLAVRGVAEELPLRAFVCGSSRAELEAAGDVGALGWIDAAGRESWRLQPQRPTRQMLVKGYGDRFRQPRFDDPVHYDQQLYGLYPRDGVDEDALAAVLHSSWFGLTLELLGRVNFGDGVLWLGLRDARALPVPDLRSADPLLLEALGDAWRALPSGAVPPVGALGLDPLWGPAVERIDALVGGLLGMSEAESCQVLPAFAALTARRVRKAASRGRSSCAPERLSA